MLNSPLPVIELGIRCGIRWDWSSRVVLIYVVKDAVEFVIINIRAVKGDLVDGIWIRAVK